MKGIEIKNVLRKNDISLASLAEKLSMTPQNLSALLSKDDVRTGTLEDIALAIGKDVPYFYGCAAGSASAYGENCTAVAGNNNCVNTERFVALLAKKDEQMDRLISIIERLSTDNQE